MIKNLFPRLGAKGATMIEYALLAFLVSVAAIIAVGATGIKVREIFGLASNAAVGDVADPNSSPPADLAEALGYPEGSLMLTFTGQDVALSLTPGPDGAVIYWDKSDAQSVSEDGTIRPASVKPMSASPASVTSNLTRRYTQDGEQLVVISGDVRHFASTSNNLLRVEQFGTVGLTSLAKTFANNELLESVPGAIPSSVLTIDEAFADTSSKHKGPNPSGVETWDTTNVISMKSAFRGNREFNRDIALWNVKNISGANMAYAFYDTIGFTGDLGAWCVEHIPARPSYFGATKAVNLPLWGHCGKPDASDRPEDLQLTINGATAKIGVYPSGSEEVLIHWGDGQITQVVASAPMTTTTHTYPAAGIYNVRVVGDLLTFRTYETLQSVDTWGKSEFTTLAYTFNSNTSLASVPPYLPETVANLDYTFANTAGSSFKGANPIGIETWDTRRVKSMSGTFMSNTVVDRDLSGWNVSSIPASGLQYFLQAATSFRGDLGEWCVPQFNQEPGNFGAPYAVHQPVWGSCGKPDVNPDADPLLLTYVGASATISVDPTGSEQVLVHWGDGSVTPVAKVASLTALAHAYPTVGTYQVRVEGALISLRGGADLVSVDAWGKSALMSLTSAFRDNTKLVSVPPSLPPTVTDLSYAFTGNSGTKLGPNPAGIETWNTANVTNMVSAFAYNHAMTKDVSDWTISKVSQNNMASLFLDSPLSGIDLSKWCVSHIPSAPTNFGALNAVHQPVWGSCGKPQPNPDADPLLMTYDGSTAQITIDPAGAEMAIIYWGDGNVTTVPATSGPASFAHNFATTGRHQVRVEGALISLRGGADLVSVDTWGKSALMSLNSAFRDNTKLVSVPPSLPPTVTDLSYAFTGNSGTKLGPNPAGIETWNTANVTGMTGALAYNHAMTKDVSDWNVRKVNQSGMASLFLDSPLSGIDLSKWCVSHIPSAPNNFGALNAAHQPVWGSCGKPQPNPDADPLLMTFEGSNAAFSVDPAGSDVVYIFWGDGNVTSVPSGSGTTAVSHTYGPSGTRQVRVEGAISYFVGGPNLVSLDAWGKSAYTSLYDTFRENNKLASVPDYLPTSVKNLQNTFMGNGTSKAGPNPTGPEKWDTSNITHMTSAFRYNKSFTRDISNWNVRGVSQGNMASMLAEADGITSDLSKWCVDHIPSEPSNFGATKAAHQPVWGSCGKPIPKPSEDPLLLTFDGTNASFSVDPAGTEPAIIFWGDGAVTSVPSANSMTLVSHTFASAGSRQVRIEGSLVSFKGGVDLVSVDAWGKSPYTHLAYSFEKNPKLTSVPSSLPTSVTSLYMTFAGDPGSKIGPNPSGVEQWDTSRISNMYGTFRYNTTFSRTIADWNVQNVNQANMGTMFQYADGVTADLSKWCVSHIPSSPVSFGADKAIHLPVWGSCGKPVPSSNGDALSLTFEGTNATFSVDPSGSEPVFIHWGDGVVTSVPATNSLTTYVRNYAGSGLHQVQVDGALTSFRGGANLISLDAWGKSPFVSLANAFEQNTRLTSVPSHLPASVNNLYMAFAGVPGTYLGPNPAGIETWNTSNVSNMHSTFRYNKTFNRNVSAWNVRKVAGTSMNTMFQYADGFTGDLGTWCVSHIAASPSSFGAINAARLPAWGTCPTP